MISYERTTKKSRREAITREVEPRLECEYCGTALLFTKKELLKGTVRKFCNKQCRKNSRAS